MKRGEIWYVNLDPTIGAEIKKKRPCVIVSNDAMGILPLKIIVPITEWDNKYGTISWHIPIIPTPLNGLAKKSSADTFQVRSISQIRFVNKIGEVTSRELLEIENGLRISLQI